ncbi:MAG: DsbA family protein [Thermoleophilaceae bacterium]
MAVRVRVFTDPLCVWSWGSEPGIRSLMCEFGDDVLFTFSMAGLARELSPDGALVHSWLDAAAESGMPADPRVLRGSPPRSSYPMSMAAKAAGDQGPAAAYRYLRALREGSVALRRKLDTTEALVEEARGAGLDAERFRVDLDSHGTVEAFGADMEAAAVLAASGDPAASGGHSVAEGGRGLPLPTFVIDGADHGGAERPVVLSGLQSPAALREAVLGAGAAPAVGSRPEPIAALRRFGRMAPVEVAAVCDLPLPKAEADLAALALEWRIRPVAVGGGRLWELA